MSRGYVHKPWIPPGWNDERVARAVQAREEWLRRKRAQYAADAAPEPDEHECYWCEAGVHTPTYGDDGVARCSCCQLDMTSEKFPRLEFT